MQFVWMVVVAIVVSVASYMLTPTPKQAGATGESPNNASDFDFPQEAEGTPQAVVFGDVRIKSQMILWYGKFRTTRSELPS